MTIADILVRDISIENANDLVQVCVPPERRGDAAFITGMAEKHKWMLSMLETYGSFAKVAYLGDMPVGQVQYRPLPDRRLVSIYCIYVRAREYWQHGAATRLLNAVIAEVRQPHRWFGGQPAAALITKTFPGEQVGQYTARAFFTHRGFRAAGDDPDILYYPLAEEVSAAVMGKEIVSHTTYHPQDADRGMAVFLYGPSFCPFSFWLLKQAEALLREVAPPLTIRWISASEEPEEAAARGDFRGCVVNVRPITAFVFDRQQFQREVTAALNEPTS